MLQEQIAWMIGNPDAGREEALEFVKARFVEYC